MRAWGQKTRKQDRSFSCDNISLQASAAESSTAPPPPPPPQHISQALQRSSSMHVSNVNSCWKERSNRSVSWDDLSNKVASITSVEEADAEEERPEDSCRSSIDEQRSRSSSIASSIDEHAEVERMPRIPTFVCLHCSSSVL